MSQRGGRGGRGVRDTFGTRWRGSLDARKCSMRVDESLLAKMHLR